MDQRLFFPAVKRNKEYIGEVLSKFLPKDGSVLEIASGSGEHGVIFQERFPTLRWQTSDPDYSYRRSISAWITYKGLIDIMPQPINLDVEIRPWVLSSEVRSTLKVIVCINMIHISPWVCTQALFEESKDLLITDNVLIIYGPFKKGGKDTSQSNALFDQSLKMQNPSWGVRHLEEVTQLAKINGFRQSEVIQMPANNLSIIFRRT